MRNIYWAGVCLAAMCAGVAQAETVSCIAQPVDTPALRDNGVTERVGDLKIICTGGTPTAAGAPVPQFNLQITTSPAVNITSRPLGGDVSEALLLMEEPEPAAQSLCGSSANPASVARPGTCAIEGTGNGQGVYSGAAGRPNAFVGRRVGETSIVWNAIPFDPPGNGPGRALRLTNIRLNASQLNNVRGGATAVNIIISTNAAGIVNSIPIQIGNPAPTVGIAQTAMNVAVSSATFLQCQSANYLGATLAFPLNPQLSITFVERFASAFRRRSAAIPTDTTLVPAVGESNRLNDFQRFETESGFYKFPNAHWTLDQLGLSEPAVTTGLGLANSGTRLLAQFKNLPAGVTLLAANHANLVQSGSVNDLTTGHVHALRQSEASGGSGPYATVGAAAEFHAGLQQGNVVTNVWEVINTNTTATERVTIPLAVAYSTNSGNNLPTPGAVTADGQMAPLLSQGANAQIGAPIPRFVEDTGNNLKPLFSVTLCAAPPVQGPSPFGAPAGSPVVPTTPTPTPTPPTPTVPAPSTPPPSAPAVPSAPTPGTPAAPAGPAVPAPGAPPPAAPATPATPAAPPPAAPAAPASPGGPAGTPGIPAAPAAPATTPETPAAPAAPASPTPAGPAGSPTPAAPAPGPSAPAGPAAPATPPPGAPAGTPTPAAPAPSAPAPSAPAAPPASSGAPTPGAPFGAPLGPAADTTAPAALAGLPAVVTTFGYQLVVQARTQNGQLAPRQPYVMRSVNYTPSSANTVTSPSRPDHMSVLRAEYAKWWRTDVPMIAALGVNTVRLRVDPGVTPAEVAVGAEMLDAFWRAGISVVMTVDGGTSDAARARVVVETYKRHPAILMWMVGEDIHADASGSLNTSAALDAASRANAIAITVHGLDGNHPVAAAIDTVRIDTAQNVLNNYAPAIDVWSVDPAMRTFPGVTAPDSLFTDWVTYTGARPRPMLVGSFGSHAICCESFYGPKGQGLFDVFAWETIRQNLSAQNAGHVAIGGSLLSWQDEWWRIAQGDQVEVGIVDVQRGPRAAYEELQRHFLPPATLPPRTLHFLANSSKSGGATLLRGMDTLAKSQGAPRFAAAAVSIETGAIEVLQPLPLASDLNTFIARQRNGTLILLALASVQPATPSTCAPMPASLVALGSQRATYCTGMSYAFAAIKGQPVTAEEQYNDTESSAGITLSVP